MKTLLVTGGAGFIGSNFIRYMLNAHAGCRIINMDLLTYAGNLESLKDVADNERYSFVRCDIRDFAAVERVFEENCVDIVVNFAAESHVDRSIVDPQAFLTTNVLGTQVLLDVAKKHWKLFPQDKYSREYRAGVKYLQVSTDEVYGALGKTGMFTEQTPLSPNSPYSASKASADLFVRAYHETFGLPVNITRCSNNYGPFQFPEKLIPLMLNNCLCGKPLPVYGDGLQIRDWLYVEDHCRAIDCVLQSGVCGEVYNIGGNNERSNIDIVRLIIKAVGASEELISYVKDRPGHDRRYAIDNTKITSRLGWRPLVDFETGIKKTLEWYLSNRAWTEGILSGDYAAYYEKMYGGSAL